MKKRVLLLTLLLSLVLAVSACGKKGTDESETVVKDSVSVGTSELLAIETGDEGEIELGEYKGITVEYAESTEEVEVTDEEVESQVTALLGQHMTDEEITDRAVEEGDIVNIDYEGTKDGVAFDGGTAQGYDLTIGSGTFIDGFEDGLIGVEIGETKDLELTFPEEYSNEDLAGQDVVFKVTVNSIRVENTPELTDDFVAENTEYKTVKEYKAGIKDALLSHKEWQVKLAKWDACWSVAVENATVKSFDKAEVESLKQEMTDYYTQMAQYYGMELEDYVTNIGYTMDQFDQEAELSARAEAKRTMVVKKIAELENISVTDEDYASGVTGIRKGYGYEKDEDVVAQVTEERLMEDFLLYKVEEFVADNAKIVAPSETEAPAETAAVE